MWLVIPYSHTLVCLCPCLGIRGSCQGWRNQSLKKACFFTNSVSIDKPVQRNGVMVRLQQDINSLLEAAQIQQAAGIEEQLGAKLLGSNNSWVVMHKIVLASVSRFLKHLLLHAEEGCTLFVLPDASQSDLDSLVEIAYAGSCKLAGERRRRKLCELAHALGISSLDQSEVDGSLKGGVFDKGAGLVEGKSRQQHFMTSSDTQETHAEYSHSYQKKLVKEEGHPPGSVNLKTMDFECHHFSLNALQASENGKSSKKKESVLKRNVHPDNSKNHIGRNNSENRNVLAPTRHECHMCGKSFSRRNDLKRHHMLHSGEHKFSCSFCGVKFVSRGDLNKHVRAHTGEKPYRCDFHKCNKTFSLNGDLNKHRRIHTNDKRFKCEQCQYRCIQSTDLRNHMLIHTNSKPFFCDTCRNSFRKKSQLKEHLKKHHEPALAAS